MASDSALIALQDDGPDLLLLDAGSSPSRMSNVSYNRSGPDIVQQSNNSNDDRLIIPGEDDEDDELLQI